MLSKRAARGQFVLALLDGEVWIGVLDGGEAMRNDLGQKKLPAELVIFSSTSFMSACVGTVIPASRNHRPPSAQSFRPLCLSFVSRPVLTCSCE